MCTQRHCPYDWHGGATVAQVHTTEERHATNVAQREWAMHALTCPKGAGKRGAVHDAISSVFQVLLENAGFLNVQLEDAWTAGRTSPASTRRRTPSTSSTSSSGGARARASTSGVRARWRVLWSGG
jgi:hypothetical protein